MVEVSLRREDIERGKAGDQKKKKKKELWEKEFKIKRCVSSSFSKHLLSTYCVYVDVRATVSQAKTTCGQLNRSDT